MHTPRALSHARENDLHTGFFIFCILRPRTADEDAFLRAEAKSPQLLDKCPTTLSVFYSILFYEEYTSSAVPQQSQT